MKLAYFAFLLGAMALLLTACGSESPMQDSKSEAPPKESTPGSPWKESKNAGGVYEITAQPSPKDMTQPSGVTLADAPDGVLIRSTTKNPKSGSKTGGAAIAITEPSKKHFSNKELTVTVVAKKAGVKPADKFAVSYSTYGRGNSGWREFKPTSQFAPYQFTYTFKATKSPDYVGVCDYSGEGRGIVVKEIKVSAK